MTLTRTGGLTPAQYQARLDAWTHQAITTIRQESSAQRQARVAAWRGWWDDLYRASQTAWAHPAVATATTRQQQQQQQRGA